VEACAVPWIGWSECKARTAASPLSIADNTCYYLNRFHFADHGALLDPPTSDGPARVVTALARIGRPRTKQALERAIGLLASAIRTRRVVVRPLGHQLHLGTWSVLTASRQAHIGGDDPAVRRAILWARAHAKFGRRLGESNDTTANRRVNPGRFPQHRQSDCLGASGLLAAGEARSTLCGMASSS